MASDWIKFRFHSLVQIVLDSISLALYLPLFSSTLDTYHSLLYSIQGSSICWTDNGIHSFNMAGLGFGRIYCTYTIPGINRHISDLIDDTTSAVIFFYIFSQKLSPMFSSVESSNPLGPYFYPFGAPLTLF